MKSKNVRRGRADPPPGPSEIVAAAPDNRPLAGESLGREAGVGRKDPGRKTKPSPAPGERTVALRHDRRGGKRVGAFDPPSGPEDPPGGRAALPLPSSRGLPGLGRRSKGQKDDRSGPRIHPPDRSPDPGGRSLATPGEARAYDGGSWRSGEGLQKGHGGCPMPGSSGPCPPGGRGPGPLLLRTRIPRKSPASSPPPGRARPGPRRRFFPAGGPDSPGSSGAIGSIPRERVKDRGSPRGDGTPASEPGSGIVPFSGYMLISAYMENGQVSWSTWSTFLQGVRELNWKIAKARENFFRGSEGGRPGTPNGL